MTSDSPTPNWSVDGLATSDNGNVKVRVGLHDGNGQRIAISLDPEEAERMGSELIRQARWANGKSPDRNRT